MSEAEKSVAEQLKPYQFKKGQSGNPEGRPKGLISFKDRIRQILIEEPDNFEEICRYYIKDKRMRDLLWKMFDGLPKQQIEHSGEVAIPIFGGKSVQGNNSDQKDIQSK